MGEPLPKTPGYTRRADAARRKREHEARMAELRPVVLARAGWRCERCGESEAQLGRARRHLEAHHRLMRGQGGPDTAENLMALCDPGGCHDWVHANPTEAYELGMLIRQSDGPPRDAWSQHSDDDPQISWFSP